LLARRKFGEMALDGVRGLACEQIEETKLALARNVKRLPVCRDHSDHFAVARDKRCALRTAQAGSFAMEAIGFRGGRRAFLEIGEATVAVAQRDFAGRSRVRLDNR